MTSLIESAFPLLLYFWPMFGCLTAVVPYGAWYVVASAAYIGGSILFLDYILDFDGAEGPEVFSAAIYVGFLTLAFLAAHALKAYLALVDWLFRVIERKFKPAPSPSHPS